jgi:hypothetical protein
MNIQYTIARYEKTSGYFLVAFNVTNLDNNDSAYVESHLTMDEIFEKTSQEICQLAFDKIKTKIDKIKTKLESSEKCVVGYKFLPDENK